MPACVITRAPASPARAHRLDQRQLAQRRRQRRRVLGGGDDVEVLDRVGLAAQRAGHLDLLGAGCDAQRADDLLGDRAARARAGSAAPAPPSGDSASVSSSCSSTFAPNPRSSRIFCCLGGRAQRIERVDPELVVEPARALGPEARQVHDRDQPARELVAQLLGGRDVAGLVEREELLLERLADARSSVTRPSRAICTTETDDSRTALAAVR